MALLVCFKSIFANIYLHVHDLLQSLCVPNDDKSAMLNIASLSQVRERRQHRTHSGVLNSDDIKHDH